MLDPEQWYYLTEQHPGVPVLALTDGTHVSGLAALTPSGCCACMLRHKNPTPQHSWLLNVTFSYLTKRIPH